MEKNNFSFVGHFKIFGIVSIILCSIGLLGIILTLCGVPALNLDLEFVGGVKMDIELGEEVTRDIQEDVASIYHDVTGATAKVTTSGNAGTAVTVKSVEISSELREKAVEKIAEKYGEDKVEMLSTGYTSASVGNDLKRSAFMASLIAGVLILIYITIRFELRSGIAAVLCLLHDVLVMIGAFVVFRLPVNMTFIAAVLTIIGYSINATIVVFDRVRENYKLQGERGDFAPVIDKSVWQTMRRSVATTITTLIAVVALLVLGVDSIKIFAIPLVVGIISGGYSSTCIAGPLWNKLKPSKAK